MPTNRCERCGQPTFGRVCGPCQQHGPGGPLMRAREKAAKKGMEVLWSNVNNAWLIVTKDKLLGIKNSVEDVLDYLED